MLNQLRYSTTLLLTALFLTSGCAQQHNDQVENDTTNTSQTGKVMKTDEEWKAILTPEEYRILRKKGTERAFTGEFWDDKSKAKFVCAGCGQELFDSDTKFESGTGWPSFYDAMNDSCITEHRDVSYGMIRTEVTCSRCDGHLGHLFNDGPAPTGMRYCINSASLKKQEK